MDDQTTQRPFRSSDSVGHAAPGKSAASTGNDPLAELARLIGQTDPFAEYARKQQLAAPSPAFEPPAQTRASSHNVAPTAPNLPPLPQPPSFIRQPFGGAPLAAEHDPYTAEAHEQDYPAPGQETGYDDQVYHQDVSPQHDDYYDEAPAPRRRMSVMVIAGVFALAVLGTAGAFGYRALFGSSGSSGPPPVIKADTAPSKIVPASTRDASSKLINDRIGDRGQTETLVSREEQPVDLKDRQAIAPFPPSSDQASAMPAQGSGVVSPDAKRVRTIAIRPDQSMMPDTVSPPPPAPATPPPRVTTVTPPARQIAPPPPPPPPASPQRAAAAAPPAEPDADAVPAAAPRKPATPRVPAAVAQHQASANAPLSLDPNAPSPGPARVAPRPAAPARTTATAPTSAAPAAAAPTAGGYAVQVSSQRSEAEAQAAFRALQGKFPDQLGNRQPVIRKVELGEKGTYYRALVPVGSGTDAAQLCSRLKTAGGSCIILRN